MLQNELRGGTVPELISGTKFTGPYGQRLILGDTDTIAFEDPDGHWQVAENVFWNCVENLDIDRERQLEAQRKHYSGLEAMARYWVQNHGQNVYEGISEDIQKESGDPLSEDDLDTILNLLERSKVTFA